MPSPRWITLSGIVLASAAMAAWQWHEYGHECQLARETVANSADSVINALVGGIRSHRRLGQFFSEQIQGVLDELAQSKDVLAVALVSDDAQTVLSAGDRDLLTLTTPLTSGETWDEAGYRLVKQFRLPLEAGGPAGPGAGRGWGRLRRDAQEDDPQSAFAPGKRVVAVLVMDRQRADNAIQRAAWSRAWTVLAGWLVVLSVGLAWIATVRLAESRGRARALELQSRHFHDLSQAAAGLAHETRNPLGLIRGWTQRLADAGMNGADSRKQAQAVIEECDRVTARINQFLAFARPSEPKLESFDPAGLIDELAVLLQPDLDAKQVTIARIAPGGAVEADREMLRQALFNLLQNAIQAAPEKGTVETRIQRRHNGPARIEVADRGPGVSDDSLSRLFAPYFTTRLGGAGLGLAIVRRIAAAHGWDAGYTARPGGGAIFWLDGLHG